MQGLWAGWIAVWDEVGWSSLTFIFAGCRGRLIARWSFWRGRIKTSSWSKESNLWASTLLGWPD